MPDVVVQYGVDRERRKARDAAVGAVTDPGRIPLSGETVTLGGLRLIMSRDLDEVELMMAGQTARLVCAATGVTSDIENEVRRQVAAEAEQAARDKAILRSRDHPALTTAGR